MPLGEKQEDIHTERLWKGAALEGRCSEVDGGEDNSLLGLCRWNSCHFHLLRFLPVRRHLALHSFRDHHFYPSILIGCSRWCCMLLTEVHFAGVAVEVVLQRTPWRGWGFIILQWQWAVAVAAAV